MRPQRRSRIAGRRPVAIATGVSRSSWSASRQASGVVASGSTAAGRRIEDRDVDGAEGVADPARTRSAASGREASAAMVAVSARCRARFQQLLHRASPGRVTRAARARPRRRAYARSRRRVRRWRRRRAPCGLQGRDSPRRSRRRGVRGLEVGDEVAHPVLERACRPPPERLDDAPVPDRRAAVGAGIDGVRAVGIDDQPGGAHDCRDDVRDGRVRPDERL